MSEKPSFRLDDIGQISYNRGIAKIFSAHIITHKQDERTDATFCMLFNKTYPECECYTHDDFSEEMRFLEDRKDCPTYDPCEPNGCVEKEHIPQKQVYEEIFKLILRLDRQQLSRLKVNIDELLCPNDPRNPNYSGCPVCCCYIESEL